MRVIGGVKRPIIPKTATSPLEASTSASIACGVKPPSSREGPASIGERTLATGGALMTGAGGATPASLFPLRPPVPLSPTPGLPDPWPIDPNEICSSPLPNNPPVTSVMLSSAIATADAVRFSRSTRISRRSPSRIEALARVMVSVSAPGGSSGTATPASRTRSHVESLNAAYRSTSAPLHADLGPASTTGSGPASFGTSAFLGLHAATIASAASVTRSAE